MTRIPGFRILRQLGDGGAADVYHAVNAEQNRHVALKVLKHEHEHRPSVVRRFRTEARIAGRLKHDTIVRLHRCSTRHAPYWIEYEYIGGGTLRDRLTRSRLALPEALRVFLSICHALDYAHRQHVIHRDIKPGNILFDREGRPYLTDFGISKDLDRTDHTRVGSQLGTLAYMSPERTWGVPTSRSAARAADIWSLGVMLFEMLTGRLPFPGPDPVLVPQIRHNAPLSLSQFAHVPPELERALDKALEKNPKRRYQTVAEFARAVREAVWAPAPGAPPPERHPRPLPAAKRRLVMALVAVLAALVVVIGLAVAASVTTPSLGDRVAAPAHTVPAVDGWPLSRAEDRLLAAEFDVHALWQQSTQMPADHVIRIEPPAGTIVGPSSMVTLYVSTGPPGGGGLR